MPLPAGDRLGPHESEIQRLRSEGETMRGIATTLNIRGYRTRRGSDWRLESVARVFNNTAV